MAIEYFHCYHSYRKKLAKLSDQEVGRLFRALLEYSETGETQELTGRESVAFDFIADDIDRAKKNYEEICKKNSENAKKRNKRVIATASDRKQSNTDFSETSETENEYENKYKKEKDNIPPKSPQQPQRTNNIKTQPDYKPEWFNRFMKAYPRGEKVKETMDVWDELRPDRELCDTMAEAIKKQLRSKQWQDKKYIPCADKWLREQRWMDKVEEVEEDDSWFM